MGQPAQMAQLEQGLIGNSDLLRQLNSALVYRLIDQQGSLSRIQIAEHSQLAPASVSKITRQLLQRGLIAEQEQQASTGGRRAISLVVVGERFQSIALRLGRHDATLALYDLAGVLLAEKSYPLDQGSQSQLQQSLLQALDHFTASQQAKIQELIAVAIAAPGLVLEDSGTIDYMPQLSVARWRLGQIVQQHTGVSCFIGHDIRSLTLAEHYFGSLRDCQHGILIRVHQGTGAGILSAGKIFTGCNGNAGEIGHIQVNALGERCHCGNFGCLETIAANHAIEQRVCRLLQQGYPSLLATDPAFAAFCPQPAEKAAKFAGMTAVLRQTECKADRQDQAKASQPDLSQSKSSQSKLPLPAAHTSATTHKIQLICQAANQGDALACQVLSEMARYLGQALAATVNLFHPQKIVLAGEITAAHAIILPVLHDCLRHQALPAFCQQLTLSCTTVPQNSAIGAFALVKQAMLNGVLLQRLLDKPPVV